MSTIQELITQSNKQIDDTYANSTYFTWFQEALNDLSDITYLPTFTDSVVASNAIDLPADFKTAIYVRNVDEGLKYSQVPLGEDLNGYYPFGDKMYFPQVDDGVNISVYYNRLPASILSIPEQVPDIPTRYQYLLRVYACKQAMLLEDEVAYEERYRAYRDEYANGRLLMQAEMSRARTRDIGHTSAWRVVR